MARPKISPRGVRRRAMLFALWAQRLEKCPSASEIAERVGVSLIAARKWRQDWLLVRGVQTQDSTREGSVPCTGH